MINITPNVKFLNTLRNSGYNNYTAIADIIDNSLDNGVGSTRVSVNIKKKTLTNYDYDYIKISDNGCGMDRETLIEALKLGANTGKDRKNDLGSYGTGLKAAALSLGRQFIVSTKTKDSELLVLDFDLDKLIESNSFEVDLRIGDDNALQQFKLDTNSDFGTTIEIRKLDRTTNKSPLSFEERLIESISLFYRLFIDNGISIYVNSKLVTSSDPMYRTESFSERLSEVNESFNYSNNSFYYTAYYLKDNGNNREARSAKTTGLYIYRNNRLVGTALDLGILGRNYADNWLGGLKIELFVNGDSDYLFGSTFMKMIHEKDKRDIDQGFLEECRKALTPYTRVAKQKNKQDTRIDESTKEALKEELDAIKDSINANKLINVPDKKAEAKEGNSIKDHRVNNLNTSTDVEKSTKVSDKKVKLLFDWNLVSFGEFGSLFSVDRKEGAYVVNINTDHIFFLDCLKDANIEIKGTLIRLFVSMAISQNTLTYSGEEDLELILNEYLSEISLNLRKLMIS